MQIFRLELHPQKLIPAITHRDKIALIGSCFTENIGQKLNQYKFQTLQNPHGILFNPVSVCNSINDYINQKKYSENDLFYLNELWNNWNFHSRFSAPEQSEALDLINHSIANANQFLLRADWLIITLGSAWIYELTNVAENPCQTKVAANNHKAPAQWFEKRLMTNDELQNLMRETILRLKQFNSGLKIIFTVSPVRHIREGFVQNTRSKARLIDLVHTMVEEFDFAYYFPAYEMAIDDLRDYRFFAEDMVHPNYAATNYIFEKFVTTCIDEDSQKLMEVINEINAAINHKPFHAKSNAHQLFKEKTLEKMVKLENKYDYLDFEKERFILGK